MSKERARRRAVREAEAARRAADAARRTARQVARRRRLAAPILPHMGWNTVRPPAGSALFAGLDAGTRFYFVHSYAAVRTDGTVTTAEHGETFVAAVELGALAATQFHPEKSGDAGAELLRNWLGTL